MLRSCANKMPGIKNFRGLSLSIRTKYQRESWRIKRPSYGLVVSVQSKIRANTFKQILSNHVIDREEFNKVRFHLNRITKRRMLLHLLAGRAEDRFGFSTYKNRLAEHLGYQNSEYKKIK